VWGEVMQFGVAVDDFADEDELEEVSSFCVRTRPGTAGRAGGYELAES
jgi:hypothetical protein